MTMILGYNTNGFPHHSLADAVEVLARIGYRSVAITLQRDQLDPPDSSGVGRAVDSIKPLIDATGLHVTIETGARFILDRDRKHHPTLISASPAGRRRRLEFLKASVEVAAALSADSVSLWSGAAGNDACEDELFDRLSSGLAELLAHAADYGIRLSFEPEPGMLIDTMERFERLFDHMNHPLFGLTLDVGHVHCLNDGYIDEHLYRWRDVLWNVHIEDMRRGVHEHLMFGDGDIQFEPVFRALAEIGYAGPVHVELSRHGHDAENIARRSYELLNKWMR